MYLKIGSLESVQRLIMLLLTIRKFVVEHWDSSVSRGSAFHLGGSNHSAALRLIERRQLYHPPSRRQSTRSSVGPKQPNTID